MLHLNSNSSDNSYFNEEFDNLDIFKYSNFSYSILNYLSYNSFRIIDNLGSMFYILLGMLFMAIIYLLFQKLFSKMPRYFHLSFKNYLGFIGSTRDSTHYFSLTCS